MVRWFRSAANAIGGGLFVTLFVVFVIQITARFGFNKPLVWTDEAAVAAAFDDVAALAPRCRFRDCAHVTEPGCAVLAAVADGTLDAGRLEDYRHLLREQAFLARKADPVAAKAERARWKQLGRAGRDAMRRKRGE